MRQSVFRNCLIITMLAALTFAIYAAGKRGLAAVIAQEPRYAIERWRSGKAVPSAAALNDIEGELLKAHQLYPESPLLIQDLGRLLADRVASGRLAEPGVLETRLRALGFFEQMLELQPSSGFAYINFAALKFWSGQIDQNFSKALRQALHRAPWTSDVVVLTVDYGVASWALMQPPMHAFIRETIRAHSQWRMFDQKPALRDLLQRYQRPDLACLVDREPSDCPTR